MNKYIEKINNDEIIKSIKPYLKDKKAFLVGGFVRDCILGFNNNDRDIVIENCDIENFTKELSEKIGGTFVTLDPQYNIYRIVLRDKINYIDIAAPIENNIEKDLLRRDLTINAVAFDINENKFLDTTGGIKDIEVKIIKEISEQNFVDDPLRLLRVFRFYSKLGFNISKSLETMVKKYSKEIGKPAKERVHTELLKLFEGEYAHTALEKMDELELLEEIFPIMKEVKKIPNNPHHHLDLFHHSIETIRQVQIYYENADKKIKEHLESNFLGNSSRLAFLKLAAFLHDIGKPSTWVIEEETKKHRFFKHDDVGSKLAIPILKELKFSKKQISYVQKLIKYHIYPSALVCSEGYSEKSQMKFFRKMEQEVIDVIALASADRLSAQGPDITQEMTEKNLTGLQGLLNKYFEIKENLKPLPKLLDGNEIMEIRNLKQSKTLGTLINKLKESQLNGEVNTKEEAIYFIKHIDID